MRGGSRQQGAGAVGADGLRLIEMRGPLNTGQLGTAPGPGQVPVSSHQQTVLIIVVFIIRVYPV